MGNWKVLGHAILKGNFGFALDQWLHVGYQAFCHVISTVVDKFSRHGLHAVSNLADRRRAIGYRIRGVAGALDGNHKAGLSFRSQCYAVVPFLEGLI